MSMGIALKGQHESVLILNDVTPVSSLQINEIQEPTPNAQDFAGNAELDPNALMKRASQEDWQRVNRKSFLLKISAY